MRNGNVRRLFYKDCEKDNKTNLYERSAGTRKDSKGEDLMNYWDCARTVLPLSNCLKRHYACVIVSGGMIIATGYNKSLEGCTTCAREGITHNVGDYAECRSVHAEQMALLTRIEAYQEAELYLVCDKDPDPTPCPICKRMMDFCGVRLRRESDG